MRVSGRSRPVTRRTVLASAVAALAGSSLAGRGGSLARGLSGSITVGYSATSASLGRSVEAARQAVLTANPDAVIELVPSDSADYLTQLGIQLITGAAPDVFLIFGLGAGELAQGGFVRPLDGYVDRWEGWEQYGQATRDGVTVQGIPWGIPWGLNPYFLYYRKDLFQAAGLPVDWQPATRDDIITAAEAIKLTSPDAIPYSLYAGANGGNATAADFMTLILSNGGTLTDSSGKWFIDSCPIRETLGFYETAFVTAQVVPSLIMTDVTPVETVPEYFGNGELGILYETAKHAGVWTSYDPDNAQQIGLALFPGNAGPFALGDVGDAWYISSTAVSPDLAWAFIETFNTAGSQAALCAEDPHLPARLDARQDSFWLQQPIAARMLEAAEVMTLPPPEPQFRRLISVVQNATGLVATGEATPVDAIVRYGDELTRTMGKTNVIAQACP